VKTTRCTHCRAEFTDEDLSGLTACPACGSSSPPQSLVDDVQVQINWHDVRILCCWAEAHAQASLDGAKQRLVQAIAERLHAQHPAKTPPTLMGELKQLSAEGHSLKMVGPDGKLIYQSPPKGQA